MDNAFRVDLKQNLIDAYNSIRGKIFTETLLEKLIYISELKENMWRMFLKHSSHFFVGFISILVSLLDFCMHKVLFRCICDNFFPIC